MSQQRESSISKFSIKINDTPGRNNNNTIAEKKNSLRR